MAFKHNYILVVRDEKTNQLYQIVYRKYDNREIAEEAAKEFNAEVVQVINCSEYRISNIHTPKSYYPRTHKR